jgi:hypothetical protein
MKEHRKEMSREKQCSGITNLFENIELFFETEMKEKEHADIRAKLRKNGNVITLPIMRRWIHENYTKNYIINTRKCDYGMQL